MRNPPILNFSSDTRKSTSHDDEEEMHSDVPSTDWQYYTNPPVRFNTMPKITHLPSPTPIPPIYNESNNSSNISEENNRLVTGEKESGKEDQHKERKKIIIHNEESPSSSSNNISLSYDEDGPPDLEDNFIGEITPVAATDEMESQQVNSFVNLGTSSSAQEHASDGGVDEGEMVSGELKDVINKTKNTHDISKGSTAKPFINKFVNIGSELSPKIKTTTIKPFLNTTSSPTTQPTTRKLLILPTEEEQYNHNHNSADAEPTDITDLHHLADFELAHDLQNNYFGEFMNNIRSHIGYYSAPVTTQFYSFTTSTSIPPSTSRSTTTTSTTWSDYISTTTSTVVSNNLEIPTDDVEILNVENKTDLFQMIEDGKNLLKTLLSNYFSTFITAIQSIWCNLVQNTSELFQSFVSKNVFSQNYLVETAKYFKC